MRIRSVRAIRGPNVYSHRPVLVMTLDLGPWADTPSSRLPGFAPRLLALFPGLAGHHCSEGRAGGFVERLRDGTYLGHVVEHVALDMSEPAGIPVTMGKTRSAGGSAYFVVVEFKAEEAMRHLLVSAVELVTSVLRARPADAAAVVAEARRLAAEAGLGPSTAAIIAAAERRAIPWSRLDGTSHVTLGYGAFARSVQAAVSDRTGLIAAELASDKHLTKRLLEQAWIPVPRGRVVSSLREALAVFADFPGPVAVKPLDSHHGNGVSLRVAGAAELESAFELARRYSPAVLLEECFEGHDYRLLVIGGRLAAASRRTAAHVVGDGRLSVLELVDLANGDPLRGDRHDKPLSLIPVDELALACLRRRGLSLKHIPAAGERVALRDGCNLSTGGTAVDVTDQVHPENALLGERAAAVLGLDIAGVDVIAPDIARPLSGRGCGVIEVNAGPGLRMHLFPTRGRPRPVGELIVERLFPRGAPSRVPIVAVTGTNGKTTITRMIGHILAEGGATVGMTTTEGVFIGGRRVASGDASGPESARGVLADRSVEAAVLETARGGIVRGGLGFDWADVAVVSNIQADHIGQDGIASVEDLAHIKALVAERVSPGGTLVLNADDEMARGVALRPGVARAPKRLVFYSLSEEGPGLRSHRAAGGAAYFLRDGWIIEAEGAVERRLAAARELPVTLAGAARFNVSNAMAALAAARACGVGPEAAVRALRGFEDNLGRLTLFALSRGRVMVDYGHNAHAFAAVAGMALRSNGERLTGIIGVPGDRADAVIHAAGRAAAKGFDRLIIKEDRDPRGRRRGDVARLLYEAVRAEAPDRACRIILDDRKALAAAIAEMEPGELVVCFYDKIEPILDVLRAHRAVRLGRHEMVTGALLGAPGRSVTLEGEGTKYRPRRHQ